MSNLTQYFERKHADLPRPKYNSGDRVYGHWNSIPFVGSVVRDTKPTVLVHSDLPVQFSGNVHYVLSVKQSDITRLQVIE
jgi:hypothetical protein